MLILLVFVMVMWSIAPTWAASCTFGTNCYCDRVVPSGGDLYDSALIVCEDWEAPTLHDDTGAGVTSASARGTGGTNAYGPWYDDTGLTNGRGYNSYMSKTYPSSNAGTWENGEPGTVYGSTTVGNNCNAGWTCWIGEWRADDRWQANSGSLADGGACVDVIKTGSSNANDESSSLGVPDFPGTTDNRGVWDGNQSFGYRIQGIYPSTSEGKACGIVGTPSISAVTHIGITMAMAYGDNTGSLNFLGLEYPLKHEEYGHTSNPVSQETLALGNVGLRKIDGFPFSPGQFHTSQSACNTALAAATLSVGQAECGALTLIIGTNASEYTQSTDWPFGKWGCVRAEKSGMGTSNMSMKIWYGNGTTEKLIFSLTNFDGTVMTNQSYNFFIWNSYMNINSPSGGLGLNGPFRRWIDNVHIRNGTPVSCAQIGFAGGGSSTPRRFNPFHNLRRAAHDFIQLVSTPWRNE